MTVRRISRNLPRRLPLSNLIRLDGATSFDLPQLILPSSRSFSLSLYLLTEVLDGAIHEGIYQGSLDGEIALSLSSLNAWVFALKLTDGAWYSVSHPASRFEFVHLQGEREGMEVRFYVNGVLRGSVGVPDLDLYTDPAGTRSSLGSFNRGAGNFFTGVILLPFYVGGERKRPSF